MQEAPVLIDSNFTLEPEQAEVSLIDTSVSEVDDLMNSAREEVAMLIAQANMKAESCLREADEQARDIKEKAYAEGYQQGQVQGQEQGYQDGLIQGRQAGREEWQNLLDQAVAQTKQMLMATEKDAKEMMKDAERQIIDIALAVSRKILAYEIAENPIVVLPLVKAALEKVSDQEDIVIRVSNDDFDSVLLAKRDLQNMVGREHALKIIPDRTIESGSCVIDTSYGTVDGRIDTQFTIIKKVLQDLVQ